MLTSKHNIICAYRVLLFWNQIISHSLLVARPFFSSIIMVPVMLFLFLKCFCFLLLSSVSLYFFLCWILNCSTLSRAGSKHMYHAHFYFYFLLSFSLQLEYDDFCSFQEKKINYVDSIISVVRVRFEELYFYGLIFFLIPREIHAIYL